MFLQHNFFAFSFFFCRQIKLNSLLFSKYTHQSLTRCKQTKKERYVEQGILAPSFWMRCTPARVRPRRSPFYRESQINKTGGSSPRRVLSLLLCVKNSGNEAFMHA